MEKKKDLRVTKTKNNLYQSLILLMKDKPFEEIKVSDLCEKALINRSTFYCHYEDKYDLLSSLIQDLKDSLTSVLNKNDTAAKAKDYYLKMIDLFLEHIEDKKEVYSLIIKNNKNSIVMDMVYSTIENDLKTNNKLIQNSSVPMEFVNRFYIGAVINVGLDYLRNPGKNTKEEVIKYLDILLPNKIC